MKNTRKLLAILLALITCLGIFSMAASAATTIPEVSLINVSKPIAGRKLQWGYTIESGEGYSKYYYNGNQGPFWTETSSEPTKWSQVMGASTKYNVSDNTIRFKADKYYTIAIPVKANSGYAFSNSLTAYINGYRAGVETGYSECIYIWRCLGKSVDNVVQDFIITGVTEPVIGATASWNWNYQSGKHFSRYDVGNGNTCFWSETDTRPSTMSEIASGKKLKSQGNFTFKANKYYTFCAYVKADPGYQIFGANTATINGRNAGIGKLTYDVIFYTFGKLTRLSSISVTTQPTKKVYTAGQNFDPKGMVVKANYSDGTSKVITNYTVTDGNNLPAGRTSVTISYTEGGVTKTTKQSITVNPAPVTFTGIEITHLPNQLEYNYKSNTSTDGLKVVAKYSNGTTKDVTDQINIINFDAINNKKGTHTAMVGYKEDGEMRTATFDFTVKYTIFQWVIIILLFGFLWY